MPSTIVGFVSGGQPLCSGNPWSGMIAPVGGVQLKLGYNASGPVYVGVVLGLNSGGITITSGGAFSSGGISDGYEIRPGDDYFVPNLLCSGQVNKIVATTPAAISGMCRLFWELR